MSANEAVSIRMIPMSDGTVHAYAPCDAGRRTHVAIDAAQYAALVAERDALREALQAARTIVLFDSAEDTQLGSMRRAMLARIDTALGAERG